jgi:hypothetical protein
VGRRVWHNGRTPGDRKTALALSQRIVGDWRNYFKESINGVFKELAGRSLIQLGYNLTTSGKDLLAFPGTRNVPVGEKGTALKLEEHCSISACAGISVAGGLIYRTSWICSVSISGQDDLFLSDR